MVSPTAHLVRDLGLTGGLRPGLEPGSSPPDLTTGQRWVMKFAVGLSYRIPVN